MQDNSEVGYSSGATVTLRLNKTTVQTATTDPNGNFTLPNILGTGYNLLLTTPSGYTNTTSTHIAINNNIDRTQNFGIVAIPNNTFLSQTNNVTLEKITCPKANGISCIAVGYRNGAAGDIILTTNDGTTFTKVLDDNIQNNQLVSIACPNNGNIFCIAAGDVAGGDSYFITTTDGINWTTTSTLSSPNVSSISCPNSNGILCVAVTSGGNIFVTINGMNWTNIQNVSNLNLNSVSCPNSGSIFCVAVGTVGGNSGSAVLTTTDGTNWTQVPNIPHPTDGNLLSVSCPHANGILCEAAGITGNGAQGIILSTIDGNNWTDATTPIANTVFNDIDCPDNSDIFCIAVGQKFGIPGSNQSPAIFTSSDGINWVTNDVSNWTSISGLKINTGFFGVACPNSNGIICSSVGNLGSAANLNDSAAVWNGWATPPNVPPSINSLSNTTINAGATYSANGFFSDSDSTSWNGFIDYGDGSGIQSLVLNSDKTFSPSHQYITAGTYTVAVYISDNQSAIGTSTSTVTVNNATPPSVGTITVSQNPVQINTATTAGASFTDPAGGSSDTALWNWGDGSTSSGTVSELNGSGSVGPDNHTYTSLGSYTVTVTVTNGNDNLNRTSQTVIAVIPTGGLRGANLTGKNYSGADLSGQNISGSNLSNGIFNNVNISNANLSGSNGSQGSYTSSNFTSANLSGGNFSRANFTGANFTNAILTGANVSNANFTNVNFTGANLKGSNFHGTTMTGVTYSNTICPNNTNSNNDGGTCIGQGDGL